MTTNTVISLILAFFAFAVVLSEVIVTLPNGQIRGSSKVTHRKNVTFYAFQQIPYGEPPLEELRFMAPQPVKNWDGILDCTQNQKICYQTNSNSDKESEDCLFLNVYTPVEPGTNSSLPVMYYIYGGGFVDGNSIYSTNAPQHFMEQDVIIVTVSYRVGPFGFLSSGDEVILGNMGLKDQSLGLKWVQKNIALFGGDPEKVTIFGQSAGAASVTYQMLSKKSAGLFRGAIGQSGSALCPWSYQRNARSIAYQVATFIDPTFDQNSTSEELLQFLQSVNSSTLDAASNKFHEGTGTEQIIQGFWYAPVVEPDVEEAFITEYMYESIANGNINSVPLLIGTCSEEFIGRAGNIDSFKKKVQNYEKDLALLVIDDFHLTSHDDKAALGEEVRKIYTDGLLEDNLGIAVRYFSDIAFTTGIIRQAQLQANYSEVYFYKFSYHGKLGNNNIYIEGADRVTHNEDKNYLWAKGDNDNLDSYSDEDVATLDRYVKLFTDFSKTLNPTPQPSKLLQNIIVPKVDPENFQYLNINDTLSIETDPRGGFKNWVKLYDAWAIKPLDTY